MRRTTSTFAFAALLAALTAGGANASPGNRPVSTAADEHARIVAYWTPERRAAATPLDVVVPAGKPDNPGGGNGNGNGGGNGGGGGGDDGGGDTGTVTGDTWTAGGAVVATTGKVFFNIGQSRYTCSASAVSSPVGNVVLTAGHCVHDLAHGFVTEWTFYPGWDGAPVPEFGAWTATDLFTTSGWAASENFDHDAGFAIVTDGTATGSLSAALGPLPTVDFATPTDASAFGFPAAKKYKGNTLTYCSGPVTPNYDGHQTMALACDMTGGSSGGPWFGHPFDNDGADTIVSLNSYGYSSLNGVMFGPILGSEEAAAYDASTLGDCPAGAGAGYACVDYAD